MFSAIAALFLRVPFEVHEIILRHFTPELSHHAKHGIARESGDPRTRVPPDGLAVEQLVELRKQMKGPHAGGFALKEKEPQDPGSQFEPGAPATLKNPSLRNM